MAEQLLISINYIDIDRAAFSIAGSIIIDNEIRRHSALN